MMLEIFLIILVIMCIIAIIITFYHNNYRFIMIKVNEAENNINMLLDKKRQLLEDTKPIIKKELKLKEFLEDLDEVKEKEIDSFELKNILKVNYDELFRIIDENEKLLKSKKLVQIIEQINNNEEEIIGSIKFYNDNVVILNKLIKSFPSNVVGFLFRYKPKNFYKNEKREIYEILKEKE